MSGDAPMDEDPPTSDPEPSFFTLAELEFLQAQTTSSADQEPVVTMNYLDSQLSLFQVQVSGLAFAIEALERDKISDSQMAEWLTTYINANPNSWVNLRTLLQYYPLTFSGYTYPPQEFVAIGTIEPFGTPWVSQSAVGVVRSGSEDANPRTTETRPFGFWTRAAGTITHREGADGGGWPNKGTRFIVYSWDGIPTDPAQTIFHQSGSGPRCTLTRSTLIVSLELGGTMTYPGPPHPDTEINQPYILGLSWDFTINPPRVCWITHDHAIEHLGPNEPTELLHITPTGLVPTAVTSMDLPYTAYHASESRPGDITLLSGGPPRIIHYYAFWPQVYMGMEEARTVHMRLMHRYCTPPFEEPNLRLDQEKEIETDPIE